MTLKWEGTFVLSDWTLADVWCFNIAINNRLSVVMVLVQQESATLYLRLCHWLVEDLSLPESLKLSPCCQEVVGRRHYVWYCSLGRLATLMIKNNSATISQTVTFVFVRSFFPFLYKASSKQRAGNESFVLLGIIRTCLKQLARNIM